MIRPAFYRSQNEGQWEAQHYQKPANPIIHHDQVSRSVQSPSSHVTINFAPRNFCTTAHEIKQLATAAHPSSDTRLPTVITGIPTTP